MKPLRMKLFNLVAPISFAVLISCGSGTKENSEPVAEQRTDTTQIIKTFVCGLWSMDSGNALNNVGFFFRPDGSIDFVGADASGTWQLNSTDTVSITYSLLNKDVTLAYRIDSLSESRMVLHDSDGAYIFRKVPFGINNEGEVLQGFGGSLEPGDEKQYTFDLPAAKKIQIKLKCDNKDIGFRVYDSKKEITSLPLHEWTSIMIVSGKYYLKLNYPKGKGEAAEYDLKVIGY